MLLGLIGLQRKIALNTTINIYKTLTSVQSHRWEGAAWKKSAIKMAKKGRSFAAQKFTSFL